MSEKEKEQVHLVAAVYKDQDRGQVLLDTLEAMHKDGNIELVDAALLTKTEDGKLQVEETAELTSRKGAKRGALIFGVVGLIFPPSLIASVIVGGGVGALAGKVRDSGLKTDQIKDFADQLQPGQAAVIALAGASSVHHIERTLEGYEGQLLTHEIGHDTSADIHAVMEASQNDGGASETPDDTGA